MNEEIKNNSDDIIEEKCYSKKDLKKAVYNAYLNSILVILLIITAIVFGIFLGLKNGPIRFDMLRYITVLNAYQNNYISDFDYDKAIEYSIKGVVNSTNDKYGGYISTRESNQASELLLKGEYYGIGINYKVMEDYLLITEVIKDSPAGRSGLKVGDKITKINGEAINENILISLKEKIKNKTDESIVYEINGEKIITVKFGIVEKPKLDYYIDGEVAYVSIYRFLDETVDLFKDAMDDISENNVKHIVFDVRNNSGGQATSVSEMLDYILEECLIMESIYSKQEGSKVYSDAESVIENDVKITILVNGETASASELFTMCLQDERNAQVIGQTTYGKSIILKYFVFKDGSILSMSVGEYCTSSRRFIEGVGIEPDIVLNDEDVKLTYEELKEKGLLD